eukprot:Amastigsp_a177793_16.p3 type:complete len:173 gc:universal Amastigsp_a177793_16:550-32(-)
MRSASGQSGAIVTVDDATVESERPLYEPSLTDLAASTGSPTHWKLSACLPQSVSWTDRPESSASTRSRLGIWSPRALDVTDVRSPTFVTMPMTSTAGPFLLSGSTAICSRSARGTNAKCCAAIAPSSITSTMRESDLSDISYCAPTWLYLAFATLITPFEIRYTLPFSMIGK